MYSRYTIADAVLIVDKGFYVVDDADGNSWPQFGNRLLFIWLFPFNLKHVSVSSG